MKYSSSFLKSIIWANIFILLKFATINEAVPFGSNSLYEPTDHITLLNHLNFKSTVLGTSCAWLIEFYSSWCGHCINFAPTFKNVAEDVKGWERVIKIGAVNCANEENVGLCREYEVMAYPTLRFFPTYSKESELGIQLDGPRSLEGIQHSIVEFIDKHSQENKVPSHWPTFDKLQNETLESFVKKHNYPELLLLFLNSEEDNYWTKAFILDSAPVVDYPPIQIVDSSRQDLISRFNIKTLPALLHYVWKDPKPTNQKTTSEKTFEVHYIEPSREKLAKMMSELFHPSPNETMNSSLRSKNNTTILKNPTTFQEKNEAIIMETRADQVFMVDLEKSILYSLGHEVSVHPRISHAEFEALKNYVTVLDLYFPGRHKVKMILRCIKLKLDGTKHEIKGQKFADMWKRCINSIHPNWEKELGDWIGCKGSQSHLRGYPCSVWTLFHILTVNVPSDGNPLSVLTAMKGYIQNFFGCSYCANHFVEMAEEETDPLNGVQTPTEAIIWLWSAHNQVNRRLRGDNSEDPQFPKIQFPSIDNCLQCLKDGKFDRDAVLDYLVELYQSEKISMDGFQIPGSGDKAASSSGKVSAIHMGALSFTNYDLSLCAVVYILSAVILLCVLFKIILKRRSLRQYVWGIHHKC